MDAKAVRAKWSQLYGREAIKKGTRIAAGPCRSWLGGGRLFGHLLGLGELGARGVGGLGRDRPRGVLGLGVAGEFRAAQPAPETLGVDAKLLGESLRGHGVGRAFGHWMPLSLQPRIGRGAFVEYPHCI